LGLVDEVKGQRICIDTAPIIYFIEQHVKYRNIIRPVFAEIAAGNIETITSTITLLEVLVHPLRTGDETLAEKYRDILLSSQGPFIAEVPELPGCAAHGRTPDEALVNCQEAIDLWLDTAKEFGREIPEPKGRRVMYA